MKSLVKKEREEKSFPFLTNIMMRSKHHNFGSWNLLSAHLVKHMNKSNIKKLLLWAYLVNFAILGVLMSEVT